MNAVIAVNNKIIERYVAQKMPSITVLSNVRRREQVIDTIVSRNPHLLVLSSELSGKLEMREIVATCRKLKPDMKIVFLYGDRDTEYKAFLDFLIRNEVYDFIIDEISEEALKKAILQNATFDDVKCYQLTQSERDSLELPSENIPKDTTPQPTTNILVVERYVGNISIAVSSLFSRAGSTHTALELCKFISAKKYDVGVVVSTDILASLKSYYIISDPASNICGCKVYDNPILAKQNHKIVIFDLGKLSDDMKKEEFYSHNIPLLICPSSPWELDILTDFIRDNAFAAAVQYLFYPITTPAFKELSRNMRQGGCKSYKLSYSPELFNSTPNAPVFNEILKPVFEQIKKM